MDAPGRSPEFVRKHSALESEVAERLPTQLGARFGADFNEPVFEEDPSLSLQSSLAWPARVRTRKPHFVRSMPSRGTASIGGEAESLGKLGSLAVKHFAAVQG